MNNNAWFKKEKPLLSLHSMGGGASGTLMQGAATKTYIDDIFSTYLWEGNATTRDINNGVDLDSEGGLVWFKNRDNGNQDHYLFDTTALPQSSSPFYSYPIFSNSTTARGASANGLKSFNSDGFSIYTDTAVNGNNESISSWSFRKAPGFFDIVTWSGNGTGGREIAHNLGSVPGCIMIKNTNNTQNWQVFHRGIGAASALFLDLSNAKQSGSHFFGDVEPTATNFTLGTDCMNNCSGYDYVAYVFAGGASDEAGAARSVEFDGSGDYLSLAASSDFEFGTGDFTIECWVKPSTKSNPDGVFNLSSTTGGLTTAYNLSMAHQGSSGDDRWRISYGAGTQLAQGVAEPVTVGQWYHLAYVRASGVSKLYVNGTEKISVSDTTDYSYQNLAIGGYYSTSYLWKGDISNFRIVKGTAVYTSSFKPPTQGLTNITNTKILCCNKNTVTGSTVTPGTITSNGNPQVAYITPFDDPAGFVFGENEDQNVITCGSYTGSGATNLDVYVGFESQYLLIKNVDRAGTGWQIFDCIRGIVTGGDDALLTADSDNVEGTNHDYLDLTSTGFKLITTSDVVNYNGDNYIYMAIRRPDGYVGKPAEAGTGVFAMDTSNAETTIPCLDSNFIVGFALVKKPSASETWSASGRLMSGRYLVPNDTSAGAAGADYSWDSNVGWGKGLNSANQSWMFKRHAGFDVVTYKGNGTSGLQIPHSLSKTPEMIWVKNRSSVKKWVIGHKDLNGGSNPWEYNLYFEDNAEVDSTSRWNDTAPTSTHFTLGDTGYVNQNGDAHIAMLFASVSGISKVGSYTGTGSSQDISLDFTPRFLIIKRTDDTGNWVVYDTTRGWSSSSNKVLILNSSDSQYTFTGTDIYAEPGLSNGDTKGFRPVNAHGDSNTNTSTYVYYAHA